LLCNFSRPLGFHRKAMKHEEHDDLWELLGRARPVKASPMFSRNVLRAVRQLEPEKERGFVDWLRAGWNWLAVTGAAAAVIALTLSLRTSPPSAPGQVAAASPDNAVLEEVLRSPDLSVIANLDMLVAMDDNDLWLDSKLR
jgi:hypothetical protein